MAWRGVHLTRPGRLSLVHGQLCVNQADEEITIPLEDIAWIVADNHRTTLTVSLLAACAEWGVAVITTDARHMPCAVTLPFHTHHRTAAIARLQLDAGAPLKKRLWQAIIRTKIINQNDVLKRTKAGTTPPLAEMAKRVRSGDPDNIEARAARDYWSALFDNFTRGNEADLRNKALNYAYAVLRGCVARALTAAGLLPAIGVHHDSMTNSFNLADDLIEPFRPFADLTVHNELSDCDPAGELTREHRQTLAALPLRDVGIGTETLSALHASEAVAQSLVRSFETNDIGELALPAFPSRQPALPGLRSERS